ncbi:hypothetical protein RB195_012453 [Necator americanus]|uniref:Uncharacterized protein n=1 Tax=Necator americanus TaxID=51031 RepID=A0ABR1D756_NECAM
MRFRCGALFCSQSAPGLLVFKWGNKKKKPPKGKEAPKHITAAVEKFLKKKLPEDEFFSWVEATAKDGKMYTYAITGELSRIQEFDRVAFDGHTELKNIENAALIKPTPFDSVRRFCFDLTSLSTYPQTLFSATLLLYESLQPTGAKGQRIRSQFDNNFQSY